MNAGAQTQRTSMWQRLFEWVHGPTDVVTRQYAPEADERLRAMEEAARRLGALEDVEEQRQERRP